MAIHFCTTNCGKNGCSGPEIKPLDSGYSRGTLKVEQPEIRVDIGYGWHCEDCGYRTKFLWTSVITAQEVASKHKCRA